MKFADVLDGYNRTHESLPAWGVRVEMIRYDNVGDQAESLPAWGVRVEIMNRSSAPTANSPSLPAWGVRVEMKPCATAEASWTVTPRMGSAG